MRFPRYWVVVVLLGVLEVAEPVPMLPDVPPAVLPVPEAPIEVPLPVEEPVEPEAVVSVLLLPVVEPVLPVVVEGIVLDELLEVVSLGDVVVDGIVLEELLEVDAPVSSFLPQADRDRAAIRASAAH